MNLQEIGDFISRTRYKIAIRIRLLIDFILLIAGIALLNFGATTLTDYLGLAMTAISVYLFITNILNLNRENGRTRVVENEEYARQLLECRLPSGFKLQIGALDQVCMRPNMSVASARPYITSPEVNELLDEARNPIHDGAPKYEVPRSLADYRARCVNLKRPNRNDPKVRLQTDVTPQALKSGTAFRVARTDYFSGSATNEMACEQFESVETDLRVPPSLQFSVSDLVIRNSRLLGLEESVLSNHVGVSTIVLTADHQLVLQDQGDQAISGNETAVGASGSLDWQDIDATKLSAPTLQGLLRYGMEREAREELSAEINSGRASTSLTGYARYLARGGKPEFFGITRTTSTLADLKPTKADKRFVANIRGIPFSPTNEGVIDVIDSLLKEGETNRRRYALSMIVSLRMGREFLRRKRLAF